MTIATKKQSAILPLFAVGLAAMLILRDVAGIGISKYIYLVYILACMVMVSYEVTICMVCFILPLVCGLPSTYIMPCILVLLAFKRGRVNFWQLCLIVFVAVMELVASFWYPRQNMTAIVQYVSFAAVMFFLIHDDREVDYTRCVQMYFLGVCLLCGVIITVGLQKAPANWIQLFAQGHFRFGNTQRDEIEGMSLMLNANAMAYYSLTGVFCGILLAEKQRGWKRAAYIAAVVFLAISGFLTVSRSWLLMGILCLILYVFSKLRSPKQFVWVLAVIMLLLVAANLWLRSNPGLLEGFTTRLNADDIDNANGRTDTFLKYMAFWASDIKVVLLGTGVTQYFSMVDYMYAMHNGTQQILVCCGLIGFTVYMAGLLIPVLRARRGRRIPMAYWLPLLSIVLFAQTIQFLNPNMLMLPYIIGIYALRAGENQLKQYV